MFTFWFVVSVAICGLLVPELGADPVNWGPMQVLGHVGKMGRKYWPLTPRDLQASCNARALAEDFHRLIKTGWGVIPPLDPYDEKNLPLLDVDDKEVQGTINLTNFNLVGAKNYKVREVLVRLKTWRLDFVFTIPLLKSNVDFHANIKVDQVNNNFKGHLNVSLNNVLIKGAVTFKSWPKRTDTNHQKLFIVAAEYNVTSSNVQYNARDLNNLTRRLETRSSDLIKTIAQKISEQQAYKSALGIITLLNKGLHRYTTAQVSALLSGDCLKQSE